MKHKLLGKIIVAMSATLLLASCTFSSAVPIEEDLAYITVEINPGFGIMVNEQYHVTYAHALNADGEMIMLQKQLEGKTLEDAIEEIVNETIALEFVTTTSENVTVDIDVISNQTTLQNQVRSQVIERIGNEFSGNMIQVQTRTRTYTENELEAAEAKGTTPLKLKLVQQAMLGNNDLLEEEALALSEKALLNKARNGAINMKKIASSLGAEFIEARQAIQDEYLPQIHELQTAIAAAITNSEDPQDLQTELIALRQEMVAEIQTLVTEYRQQSVQARENWQIEANNRKGGSQSSQGSNR